MKISYISGAGIPSVTADSIGVICLCEAFAALGCDTSLIIRNKFWERLPNGYNGDIWDFYGVSHKFKVRKIAAIPRFTWWFERSSLNVVDRDSLIYTRSITLVARALASQFHVVLELHDVRNPNHLRILEQCVESPRFLGIVVITEALRLYYIDQIPSSAKKIVVAPDAVRYSSYAGVAVSVKSRGCGREANFVAGYVGSFYQGKGVEVIVKLAELCPKVSFSIYGGTKNEIRSRLGINELPGNLEVHSFVPQSRVPQCMASFDVALLPNQEKVLLYGGRDIGKWTSPIKMFEYMASGCAIVASDLTVLREVLKDNHNALLVPPTDYDAWRRAIQLLRSDPELCKRLGKQAQKEACQKYSWRARAERIIQELNLEDGLSK